MAGTSGAGVAAGGRQRGLSASEEVQELEIILAFSGEAVQPGA
jgi:hypothetical protein